MATRQKINYPTLRDPFKHQLEGIKLGLEEKTLAIFFEPRLGKTATSLLIAAMRFQRGEVYRVLVGCKKTFMQTWEDEAKDTLDIPYEMIRVGGKRSKRFKLLNTVMMERTEKSQLTIVLVNYEFIWRALRDIRNCGFDMIILDESRRIAGPYSNQSRACHSLGDETEYKIIMTGTPMGEDPLDIFSQYRFLNRSVFGDDYDAFFRRYAKTWTMGIKLPNGSTKEVEKVVGTKNKEHLIKLIQSQAIVRTQKECLDLPPMSVQPVWVDLDLSTRKLHDALGSTEPVVIDGEEVESFISLQTTAKQVQITGGFLMQSREILQIGTEKLDAMEELIDDHPTNWKFVILTKHIHEIDAILVRLKKMKRNAYDICGRVSDKDRDIRIKNFQQYSRYTDLVVQADVAALGLDFTASNSEIFYTPPFSYEMYYQGTQRVQGPKQKRPIITIFQLRAKKTADDKVYTSLNEKRDVEQYILGRHRRI